MLKSKIKRENLEFIFISIYITSKLLWDTIPYVFELIFWALIFLKAINYIYPFIKRLSLNKLLTFMSVFCIYILLNGFLQDDSSVFARSIYEYIAYMLVMLYFIQAREKIDLIYCLKRIVVWGCVISVLTWYEYITKQYILTDLSLFGTIMYVGNNGFRAAVFSRSFLSHGMILGVFSLMSLYLWYVFNKKKYLVLSAFAYVSILATGSRGPFVACFVAIAFFYFADAFIIRNKRSQKDKFIIACLVCILILIVVLNIDVDPSLSSISYFIYRIQNIFNWTGDAGNTGRILIWNNSINNWFKKSPIFGIGPSKTGSWGESSLGVTESSVLKKLCELGVVGTILFYALIYFVVKNSIKLVNVSYRKEAVFWLSLFIAIFINDFAVQSTEEIMVAFWFWCSLGGIYYLKRKDFIERGIQNI